MALSGAAAILRDDLTTVRALIADPETPIEAAAWLEGHLDRLPPR